MNRTRSATFGFLAISLLASIAAIADSTTRESTTSSANRAHAQKITIGNFTFQPAAVTISLGTALTWVNEDDVPHIVIGTDGDSPIKSKPLDTDDRYSVTITKPGTYKYFCSMHPHMTGTIVVR